MSFEVILSDLRQMQHIFETEGDHIADVCHKVSVDAVSTGNSDLDRALEVALDKLGVLQAHVAGVISEHAVKLRDTHDEYAQSEGRGYQLFDRLLKTGQDQKPETAGGCDDQ